MFFIKPVYAQCPVCIITVGGGMLLAKKLGIDDLLVSIWISALNTAISFWIASKFKNRLLQNPLLLSLLMYGLTIAYFQFSGQMGHLNNRLLGIDKIFLGQTLGLVAMVSGNIIYLVTKKNNGGKALVPSSKVVFPVVIVILITSIFKFAFNLR